SDPLPVPGSVAPVRLPGSVACPRFGCLSPVRLVGNDRQKGVKLWFGPGLFLLITGRFLKSENLIQRMPANPILVDCTALT
ncbi:MAG: hypothetical protein ACI87E_005333, partial [Mariniblastus sp.]